jgi:hypothetical protein
LKSLNIHDGNTLHEYRWEIFSFTVEEIEKKVPEILKNTGSPSTVLKYTHHLFENLQIVKCIFFYP